MFIMHPDINSTAVTMQPPMTHCFQNAISHGITSFISPIMQKQSPPTINIVQCVCPLAMRSRVLYVIPPKESKTQYCLRILIPKCEHSVCRVSPLLRLLCFPDNRTSLKMTLRVVIFDSHNQIITIPFYATSLPCFKIY